MRYLIKVNLKNPMRKIFAIIITIGVNTMSSIAQPIEINEPVRFLALGDSYTIGQSVDENQRWPVQLINGLKKEYGIQDAEVDIIARTGWTTGNLKNGIAQQLDTEKEYNLASLLIGVNNQYQGLDSSIYAPEFRELLDIAIGSVGGDRKKVFVVSIPDYAYTPSFRNDERVSNEIDAYNAVNESIAKEYGVAYFNITPISRNGLGNPDLVADDRLHPSGLQYKQWVSMMIPQIKVNAITSSGPEPGTATSIKYGLSQGNLSISLPAGGGRLSLYDATGRIMAVSTLKSEKYMLNVERWTPGFYFINYQVDDRSFTKKVYLD